MGFLLSIAAGAIIGWLASIVVRGEAKGGSLGRIVLGVVGALLGGFVLGPLLGGGNLLESELDIRTLPVALLGSFILLAAAAFFRRRRMR